MNYCLKLYKYKPLVSNEDLNRLEDFLCQKIWIPPLSSLNDLQEGAFQLTYPTNETMINNPALSNILEEVCKEKGVNFEEYFNLLIENQYQVYDNIIRDQFSDFGVFSFTSDYLNEPMWAHYGAIHKGYCAIFELDFGYAFDELNLSQQQKEDYICCLKKGEEPLIFSVDTDFIFAFCKVRYEPKLPVISFEEALKNKDKDEKAKMRFMLKILGTKLCTWSYESEYRLIANLNSLVHGEKKPMSLQMYAPFIKMTGIIMGKYMEDKDQIQRLCEKHQIDLFQSILSKNHSYLEMNQVLVRGKSII
ncbi:TPA: DUF2971 domain-containing protein [Legionella pneumophila]|nr:DUF2971 domain-containing protein [Legionella pneumophila]